MHRLVLVHGFTQTARCWSPFDRAVAHAAPGVRIRAVDAPGHGEASSVAADIPSAAAYVTTAGGRGVYLGYSMGGRICLQAALDQPELVRAVVLVSATAGLVDPTQRAARRARDDRLARRLEAIGVARFVDEWLDQPLFAHLERARAHVDERRRNTVPGLASSLRRAGTGAQTPLWDRLGELAAPVLLVVGELDPTYVAIAHEMAALLPRARVAVIAGAGHSVHLERPDDAAAAVGRWFACVGATTRRA